jgi:hypothetical protein
MLCVNPDRSGYRYEIVKAVRYTVSNKQARQVAATRKS